MKSKYVTNVRRFHQKQVFLKKINKDGHLDECKECSKYYTIRNQEN